MKKWQKGKKIGGKGITNVKALNRQWLAFENSDYAAGICADMEWMYYDLWN